jgi:Tfp pilus assembly protein PilZ
VSSAQGFASKAATARIRFESWAEFARFLHQDGGSRGLFVRADAPPPIGTDLNVQFVLPDQSELVLAGRVVHCLSADEARAANEEPGMGVQFTHMSAEQAERVEALMAQANATETNGNRAKVELERPAPTSSARPRGASMPVRDPRLEQVAQLLERGRFDAAERRLGDLLAESPDLTAAKILLLVAQARRARAQFDFELALELYTGVLMLDSTHREALDQMEALRAEATHTKELYERVFGRPRPRSAAPK